MVFTRSMMKRLSRPSFYSMDLAGSGSSNVFIRESRDTRGNPTREVIDLRRPSKRRKLAAVSRRSNMARTLKSRRSSSLACALRRSIQKRCSAGRGSPGEGELWHRTAKSRGSSLWEEAPACGVAQRSPPPFAYQPTSMAWWLRTFRGLGGQVERQVQQMVALQLGVLEQFRRWDRGDRLRLQQAIPDMAASLERVQVQTVALSDWLSRLGSIVAQDLAASSQTPDSAAGVPKSTEIDTDSRH